MTTPERIYGWRDSQLSIARFAGGCTYNGQAYTIAMNEEGQPLVRWDVLKREAKEKKASEKEARAAAKAGKAAYESTFATLFTKDAP